MTAEERRIHGAEKRNIASILIVSLLCLVVIGFAYSYLLGAHRRLDALQEELDAALASYEPAPGALSLGERIIEERNRKVRLLEEWARYSNLLDTWKSRAAGDAVEGEEKGRIDFKVAFFETRRRLTEKALEVGSALLDEDLGVGETIGADEDTSDRLLQLAAVEKLVGFALEERVGEVRTIEVLPPRPVPVIESGRVYLDEYPVRLVLQCSLQSFRRFLKRVDVAKNFFTVAHLKVEKASMAIPDLLNVTVFFNALILKEKSP